MGGARLLNRDIRRYWYGLGIVWVYFFVDAGRKVSHSAGCSLFVMRERLVLEGVYFSLYRWAARTDYFELVLRNNFMIHDCLFVYDIILVSFYLILDYALIVRFPSNIPILPTLQSHQCNSHHFHI